MQDILSNQEIDKLDLSKIAALQQKRTLAFLNHFVITTVQFLNTFAKKCEKKLMQFEQKLEKVEAAMILLEARLSSIPEINETLQTDTNVESLNTSEIKSEDRTDDTKKEVKEIEDKPEDNVSQTTTDTVIKPEYERFIKLVQVGVPLQAVKLKISIEGLDPDEFESMLKK
ncbi:WASH complex subunit CCDC53 [Papilio machaon]|uniref:WASH complex subunit CCDC53 n=1 Tax=Papilio machaon TaxID=76193 RepID=A0A194QMT2_PAPMA|nr:WASH complex subunit CCDC53 [Papilio machaon]